MDARSTIEGDVFTSPAENRFTIFQRGLPSNEGLAVCREKAVPFSRLF